MKLHKLKTVLIVAALLQGCTFARTLKEHREVYCAKSSDSFTKAVALRAIRTQIPFYPAEGVCRGYTSPAAPEEE